MAGVRKLVVNADDFGFTRDVNAGIVEAHRRGIVRAATLMANGPAFDDALRLARENPGLDVGCHIVLVQLRSAATGDRLPPTPAALARAVALGRFAVHEEIAAQVRRVVEAGIRPTHLDTHKHTHLLPPVLEAAARVSGEFGIPWVRRPFDFPMKAEGVPWKTRLVSRCLGSLRRRFDTVLARHGRRSTDHFAGFQWTGRFRTAELVRLLRELPAGSTEFMCHPGRCGPELLAAPTRLKQSRETELEALTAPETLRAVEEEGIQLVSYRELQLPSP